MLTIVIGEEDYYDEVENLFTTAGGVELVLEHSLVSLSKWEQFHQKPFLGSEEKAGTDVFDYIKMMILNDVDPDVVDTMNSEQLDRVNEYLNSAESATTFGQMPATPNRGEVITAELIYYWMIAFNIPFECQTWHLNRLFALIRICNIKNTPPKKMSKGEMARRNHAINEQRKAKYGTRG